VRSLIVIGLAVLLAACSGTPDKTTRPSQPSPTTAPPSSPAPATLTPTMSADVDVTVIQQGLSVPWDLAFAPDGKMFVTQRSGTLLVFESGEPSAKQISSFAVPDVRYFGEAGLMGVAVDPDYASNGFIYVCASRDSDGDAGEAPWVNELLRLHVDAAAQVTFDKSVLSGPPRANRQHNGCAVQIDDTDHIWMTMGDSLAGMDGWAQDPARLNGKVLRLNLDGSVPADNPVFEGVSGATAVYSMGHRNPQGIAFHPVTKEPYVSEHGPTINDEVNHVVAGGNYGWPCVSGAADPGIEDLDPVHCTRSADFRPPAWASGDPTWATSGDVFLAGSMWGEWENNLIVSCLKEQDLRRFSLSADGQTLKLEEILLNGVYGRMRAAVLAPDGSLYVSTSNQANAGKEGEPPQPDQMKDFIVRLRPK
jgi:glucose/arabinose dehydrogenase